MPEAPLEPVEPAVEDPEPLPVEPAPVAVVVAGVVVAGAVVAGAVAVAPGAGVVLAGAAGFVAQSPGLMTYGVLPGACSISRPPWRKKSFAPVFSVSILLECDAIRAISRVRRSVKLSAALAAEDAALVAAEAFEPLDVPAVPDVPDVPDALDVPDVLDTLEAGGLDVVAGATGAGETPCTVSMAPSSAARRRS